MRKSHPLAASAAFLLLLAGPVLGQSVTPEAEPKAADEAGDPAAEYGEVVFVEESLPFLPDTNTITAKLPLETGWTPANVGVVSSQRTGRVVPVNRSRCARFVSSARVWSSRLRSRATSGGTGLG